MKKFYSGPVFYDIIKAVRDELTIPVIANGGALSQPLYQELVTRSGCANGMVARGACGNPWIFREIAAGQPDPPTLQEFAAEIRLHFESMMRFYGQETGFRICRKTLLAYLLGRGFPGELRASVSTLNSLDAFETMMRRVEAGPAERYWQMLAQDPSMERRLKPDS